MFLGIKDPRIPVFLRIYVAWWSEVHAGTNCSLGQVTPTDKQAEAELDTQLLLTKAQPHQCEKRKTN